MKVLFAFGVIVLLCILGGYANEERPATEEASASEKPSTTTEIKEKICEPGALSEIACNTCICNKDGTELACTKKICVDTKEDTVVPQNLPVVDNLPSEVPETKERRRRRGF